MTLLCLLRAKQTLQSSDLVKSSDCREREAVALLLEELDRQIAEHYKNGTIA